jgi:hypothetical protein
MRPSQPTPSRGPAEIRAARREGPVRRPDRVPTIRRPR